MLNYKMSTPKQHKDKKDPRNKDANQLQGSVDEPVSTKSDNAKSSTNKQVGTRKGHL